MCRCRQAYLRLDCLGSDFLRKAFFGETSRGNMRIRSNFFYLYQIGSECFTDIGFGILTILFTVDE